MRRRTSLTWRLTALFAVGAAVVLLGLGALIAKSIERHFIELDTHALHGKLELVRHALAASHGAVARPLTEALAAALTGHHELALRVETSDGRALWSTPEADVPGVAAGGADAGELITWHSGGRRYRGLVAMLDTDGVPLRVTLGVDLAHHDAFMRDFQRSLWGFVAVAALLLGVVGWLAVRRGLAPLAEMRARAAAVNARRLDQRLPVDAVPAELAALADTLNEMLARLQEAFARLSDFSSDLAHELRTPISNLTIQTQVALSQAREAGAYREVLESNAEEYERLARMIGDMLFLAQTENGLALARRERVDLAAEAASLVEFYGLAAEERGLSLRVTGAGDIEGDRLMLRRALGNLLSNAIRHATACSAVDVSITTDAEWCRVAVVNLGTVIAPEHLPHVFDRFWRGDRARAQQSGTGTGLGLAITRAIAQAHGGRCEVASTAEGDAARTVFALMLPRV